MSTFPTLIPSGRTFTPGEYPHTSFQAYNGLAGRVRHSNVMLTSQLRLTFTALTEADMLTIISHYNGQYGTFDSFTLPSAVWSGAVQADYELTSYRWRYNDSPVVEDVYCDRYNVELTIETVPPDSIVVDGGYLAVYLSISGGAIGIANGLAKTVTSTIADTGAGSAGANFTVGITLDAPSYWSDMAAQVYGWESLGYIEWWGN